MTFIEKGHVKKKKNAPARNAAQQSPWWGGILSRGSLRGGGPHKLPGEGRSEGERAGALSPQ